MSRHKVPLRDGIAAASAFVGWDRPLQTYFAQVLSAPDEDGEEIELVWVGTAFGELPRAVDAIRVLEPYCQIEASLAAQLEIDRMACLATRDGPNQLEAGPIQLQATYQDSSALRAGQDDARLRWLAHGPGQRPGGEGGWEKVFRTRGSDGIRRTST